MKQDEFPKSEDKAAEKMREFFERGFTIVEDTVYSTPEHENDICPCFGNSLGRNIQIKIRFDDSKEEVLLHRYHSMKN